MSVKTSLIQIIRANMDAVNARLAVQPLSSADWALVAGYLQTAATKARTLATLEDKAERRTDLEVRTSGE